MSNMFEQAQQAAGGQIKRLRWVLGLSGLASVLFGVVIIVWPNISLLALVILFGAFSLVRGIFGLGAAIRTRLLPKEAQAILRPPRTQEQH